MAAPKPDFAQALDLALKALSIGRGRLAAEVGVDKSLVTRWLGGTMRPSPHNLERISRTIAAHCPGFTMLDWESDLETLARRLGVAPPATTANGHAPPAPSQVPAPGSAMMDLPFGLVEAAEQETARKGQSYAGRWRCYRLSGSGKLVYVMEHVLIRPRGRGLWFEHFGYGHRLAGWALVLGNRLYVMVADETDDSFGFYLLNGVVGPRALRLDGMLTSVGTARKADCFAMIVVLDRCGDLEGEDADIGWATDPLAATGIVEPDSIDPVIRAALAPDCGPAAAAAGTGDAILRIPFDRSLATGVQFSPG